MKTIKISRRRWWRGQGWGALYVSAEAKMCCLGFVCRAYGVSLNAIRDHRMPRALSQPARARLPKWLLQPDRTSDVNRAAVVNDRRLSEPLSEPTREAKIAAIFKRHGLRAVFTK